MGRLPQRGGQAHRPLGQEYGWAYVNDGSEDTVWRYLALLWQAGGELLNSDNTKPAFNSAAGRNSLQLLQDMAVKDKSVYLDNGNGNYLNLFNSGKIGMLWTGPWDLSSINKDVDYGVALLPGYNGNHETISGPDLWMAFNHTAARTKTTLAFMKWLTSPGVHMQYALATGNLPIRKSETQLPEYQDFLKKYPGNKVFVQNLDNVKHVRPNVASYGEISTAIGQMVQSVLIGKADPQEALTRPLTRSRARWPASNSGDSPPAGHRAEAAWTPGRTTADPWQARTAAGRPAGRVGHGRSERGPHRDLRAAAGGLVAAAVVPAQRPPDTRDLGGTRQLPPAQPRPGLP